MPAETTPRLIGCATCGTKADEGAGYCTACGDDLAPVSDAERAAIFEVSETLRDPSNVHDVRGADRRALGVREARHAATGADPARLTVGELVRVDQNGEETALGVVADTTTEAGRWCVVLDAPDDPDAWDDTLTLWEQSGRRFFRAWPHEVHRDETLTAPPCPRCGCGIFNARIGVSIQYVGTATGHLDQQEGNHHGDDWMGYRMEYARCGDCGLTLHDRGASA